MKEKCVQVWVIGARRIVDKTALAELASVLRERSAEVSPILVLDVGAEGEDLSAQLAAAIAALPDPVSEAARCVSLNEITHSGSGEMTEIDGNRLRQLLDLGLLPVLSPSILGSDGTVHHLDATAVATQIALTLEAQKLILLGNLPGVKITGRTMRALSLSQISGLITDGYLAGQELAAVQSAVTAIQAGVFQVLITDLAGLAKDGGTAIVNG